MRCKFAQATRSADFTVVVGVFVCLFSFSEHLLFVVALKDFV